MISVQELFQLQKDARAKISRTTPDERRRKLLKLKASILDKRDRLYQAFADDFSKPQIEVEFTEIHTVVDEINLAVAEIERWMRPQRIPTPFLLSGTRSSTVFEAKGQVLIMAPWNYPMNMLLTPFVSAVAAGNVSILRPSTKTPQVAELMREIIAECFPPEEASVVLGDTLVADQLLELPFDHIFFTGSTEIGKKVMQAASKNLSTVTLELGGKSPAILDVEVDLDLTVERMVWAKFLNAGQTCVCPDHFYVPRDLAEEFSRKLVARIQKVFGANPEIAAKSKDLASIIDEKSTQRLMSLINDSVHQGARLDFGSLTCETSRRIPPTVLSSVQENHPIMGQEIFGPILPILSYEKIEDVLMAIGSRPKPLALYVCSNRNSFFELIQSNTSSGALCQNIAVTQVGHPQLPFGGVGYSGQGNYHGFYGFKTFSHEKAVMKNCRWSFPDLIRPPYDRMHVRSIKSFVQWLSG